MISCAELRVDEKIRQIAVVKHDSKILSSTSDELFSKDAKYHSSCYKDYTTPQKQLAENNDPINTDILKTVVKELVEQSDDKIVQVRSRLNTCYTQKMIILISKTQ